MKKALAGALVAAAVLAGCGGDDNEDTTTQGAQQTDSTQPQATQPTGKVPTYEEAVKIAMENPGTKKACSGGKRDERDIGVNPDGETYKRLLCANVQHLDYVVGKQVYSENFEAARGGQDPVWAMKGQAYIEGPQLDKDFAERVKEACGCGEVVSPKSL